MKRLLISLLLGIVIAGSLHEAEAQTARERGIGPFNLSTRRGDITIRLLRREGDMIWLDRQVQSGQWIETGVPKIDIIEFRAPRPPEFIAADAAQNPEQIASAIDQLRRMVARLRAYRDLPGIPVHEALLLTAQLNERREFWRDALQNYEELLAQTYAMSDRPLIRYRAGLCLAKMQQYERALAYLLDDPVPEEDLDLWSLVMQARAGSLAATGRHREAVDALLHLIVFHPYSLNNEVNALANIIPAYIAIGDWDAVMKSYEALQRDYPEAPETTTAGELLAAYTEKVDAERAFQIIE
jgi:tetratricopeptide (TPR) repeat protein